MQLYDPNKLGAPTQGIFNPREKKRLVLMIVGAVVMLGAVIAIKMQATKRSEAQLEAAAQLQPEPLPTEIAVPKIDVAALEAAADDADPAHRVVLPGPALEAGFAQSSQVYDGAFAALGGRELTAAIAQDLLQAPQEHRGKLLRIRCFVDELRELPNPTDTERPRTLAFGRLEDGAPVGFAAQDFVGLAPVPGDFVRVDALFVRAHRVERDGAWVDVPLFVGPRMVESSPKLPPVRELGPDTFEFVRDDSVANGFEGLGHDAYWDLISYVKHLEPGAIDWEQAPVLDNTTISSIFADGKAWRGKPVRIPVARMLHVWTEAQGENPLRIDQLVVGWFGRGDWVGQAKVAYFVSPLDGVPPNVGKNMTARGFFFKNLGYVPKNGGAAIAPCFVIESVQEFVPPDNAGLRQIAYIVAGSLAILALGIVIMVRRDRKASDALEAELLRRRRERRGKVAATAKP
jgi:hypothetical protein